MSESGCTRTSTHAAQSSIEISSRAYRWWARAKARQQSNLPAPPEGTVMTSRERTWRRRCACPSLSTQWSRYTQSRPLDLNNDPFTDAAIDASPFQIHIPVKDLSKLGGQMLQKVPLLALPLLCNTIGLYDHQRSNYTADYILDWDAAELEAAPHCRWCWHVARNHNEERSWCQDASCWVQIGGLLQFFAPATRLFLFFPSWLEWRCCKSQQVCFEAYIPTLVFAGLLLTFKTCSQKSCCRSNRKSPPHAEMLVAYKMTMRS